MQESSDESSPIVFILILLAMLWAVEARYEPDSFAGYAVGFFALPGELMTGTEIYDDAMAEISPALR